MENNLNSFEKKEDSEQEELPIEPKDITGTFMTGTDVQPVMRY